MNLKSLIWRIRGQFRTSMPTVLPIGPPPSNRTVYSPPLNFQGQITNLEDAPAFWSLCSDVYKAQLRGKVVAVKSIRFVGGTADPNIQAVINKMASRELHVWKKTKHKNILPVLGFIYPFKGTIAFVSEWIEGGCARDFVKEHESIDHVWLLREVADGLRYLHRHNIIHGDVKGTNILIRQKASSIRVMLCDFGLSKALGCTGYTTVAKGTYPFMAKELHRHTKSEEEEATCVLTFQTDVWAWGMTAYELFTHTVPYEELGYSDTQLILHIDSGGLPGYPGSDSPAATLGLTEGVWGLLTRCWDFEPGDRPTSGEIFNEMSAL